MIIKNLYDGKIFEVLSIMLNISKINIAKNSKTSSTMVSRWIKMAKFSDAEKENVCTGLCISTSEFDDFSNLMKMVFNGQLPQSNSIALGSNNSVASGGSVILPTTQPNLQQEVIDSLKYTVKSLEETVAVQKHLIQVLSKNSV